MIGIFMSGKKNRKKTKTNGNLKRTRLIVALALLIVILLIFFWPQSAEKNTIPRQTVEKNLRQGELSFLNDQGEVVATILIEIADDAYSRAHGLMFRDNLPANQGMLFIFEQERAQYFWMKNTPVSLDMIFVNENREIVNIEKYTEPFSMRSYPSIKPAKYVVEVVAGYTDQFNIKTGDKIRWKEY